MHLCIVSDLTCSHFKLEIPRNHSNTNFEYPIYFISHTMTCDLRPDELGRIAGLQKGGGGLSGNKIDNLLEHPQFTIYTVFQRYKRTHNLIPFKSSGRPPKLSVQDIQHVEEEIKCHQCASAAHITSQLDLNASPSLIRTVFNKLSYHSRVPAHKPYLKEDHIQKRLEFAHLHQYWTVTNWKNLIWSDKSLYEVGKLSEKV